MHKIKTIFITVLVFATGCCTLETSNIGRSIKPITWQDYISLVQADRADSRICRRFLHFCVSKDSTKWEEDPIWVLANIEFTPLGNAITQWLEVDHICCERLSPNRFPGRQGAFPVIMRVINDNDSWMENLAPLEIDTFGFYSIRCACLIVPRKSDGYMQCDVITAYTLDSPENHIAECFYRMMDKF